MFDRYLINKFIVLMSIIGFIFIAQSAFADWGVSVGSEYNSPYSSYYGDRINNEYRRGFQTDDWVERGSSSVTESPIFSDGIRLASWSTNDEDNYDYGIASAIYYFEIPAEARSARIKVYYDGDGYRDDTNNEIAGRVWIKKTAVGDDYEEYSPSDGKYESVDKPLYGDTFALTASKHLEIIRISAKDHVEDGIMELHVVAEGKQRIDVKYIEVETYTYMPTVRVVTSYIKDYSWGPWQNYGYWYFYTGPVFYFSDYYYMRYTYPSYQIRYNEFRRHYDDYLRGYYVRDPYRGHHISWNDVGYDHRRPSRDWNKDRLNKWTSNYEEARRDYIVTTKTRKTADVQQSREKVRSILSNSPRQSPSAVRTRTVEARGSAVTEMKRRNESPESVQRAIPESRSRSVESRGNDRTPTRVETSDSTKRTIIRTQKDTSNNSGNERVIRKAPTQNNTQVQEQRKSAPRETAPRDADQSKKRRESVRSQDNSQQKKSEEPRKSEQVQPKEEKQPSKDAEVKKDDTTTTDDEDKDKEKNRDNSGSGDSSTRKRVRGR
jgi:hypothetical protein